ncbi:MAG: adenylyltransferase/cytidyltransferase family protein [Christensenellales bacterium]
MKKVITFGVFDYFHFGHLRLIENASKYGDYLIVAVQDEAYIKKYKPNTDILYSAEQMAE